MANNTTGGCASMVITEGFYAAYIAAPLCFFIICENLLGMITIWRTPELHTNANRFVFSLAMADIHVAVAYVLVTCERAPYVVLPSPFQEGLESFILGNTISMITLSCLHMGIIAIDRYIYIVYPFYYITNATKRRNLLTIFSIWFVCIVYQFLPLFVFNDKCILSNPPRPYYLPAFVLYLLNLVTVCSCYFKIAKLAYRRKKYGTKPSLQVTSSGLQNSIMSHKNRTAAMKSAKFFVVMFGIFCFCTIIPGLVVLLDLYFELSTEVYTSILFLFLINSGINFIVYALMFKAFAQALKKTIFCQRNGCC